MTVHFIINYSKYSKHVKACVKPMKWLVTSVDTDQWVLLLSAMGTRYIPVDGPSSVDITVVWHVKSTTGYVHISRVYQAIVNLSEEGSHAGWREVIPS